MGNPHTPSAHLHISSVRLLSLPQSIYSCGGWKLTSSVHLLSLSQSIYSRGGWNLSLPVHPLSLSQSIYSHFRSPSNLAAVGTSPSSKVVSPVRRSHSRSRFRASLVHLLRVYRSSRHILSPSARILGPSTRIISPSTLTFSVHLILPSGEVVCAVRRSHARARFRTRFVHPSCQQRRSAGFGV